MTWSAAGLVPRLLPGVQQNRGETGGWGGAWGWGGLLLVLHWCHFGATVSSMA